MTILINLLNQDDETLDSQILPYLSTMMQGASAEVIALVDSFFGRGERWHQRLLYLFRFIADWSRPENVAFFARLVREVPEFDLKQIQALDDVAQDDPKAGCLLLHTILDRIIDVHLENIQRHQAQEPPDDRDNQELHLKFVVWLGAKPRLSRDLEILNGSSLHEALKIVVDKAPQEFLDEMLPWIERAVNLKEEELEEGWPNYQTDPLYSYWYDGVDVVQHQIVGALTKALIAVARSDASGFQSIAARLCAMPNRNPHQLLARVYAAMPERFATEALCYLQGDPRRLRLGDKEAWQSREVLKAIVPHLDTPQKAELESLVLGYENKLEIRNQYPGLTQLRLLREIKEHLSVAGLSRLNELERKGYAPSSGPSNFMSVRRRAHKISEEIRDDTAKKMSDEAWLRAMGKKEGKKLRRYRALEAIAIDKVRSQFPSTVPERILDELLADDLSGNSALKGYSGGPPSSYVKLVKENPQCFSSLLLRAPMEVRTGWIEATINGIAESEIPADASMHFLLPVILRYGQQPRREMQRSISWALQAWMRRHKNHTLPPELLDLLEGWVRGGAAEVFEVDDEATGVYTNYANSNRGVAFGTLMLALQRYVHPQSTYIDGQDEHYG